MDKITRKDAKAAGLLTYFTDNPCIRGHIAARRTKNTMCVQCNSENCRRWADANREWTRNYGRNYMRELLTDPIKRQRVRDQARARDQKQREEFARATKPENCEACGATGRIVFDHCHASKAFRGWLCTNCNVALGLIGDDPTRLRSLAAYAEARTNLTPNPNAVLPKRIRAGEWKFDKSKYDPSDRRRVVVPMEGIEPVMAALRGPHPTIE